MANNIGGVNGYGYGIGNYVPPRKNNEEAASAQAQEQQALNNHEETRVDPQRVMDFLAHNNLFVAHPTPATDPTAADRVAGYMDNFELLYAVVEQEFGEFAPMVMDAVMDKLMGMVD